MENKSFFKFARETQIVKSFFKGISLMPFIISNIVLILTLMLFIQRPISWSIYLWLMVGLSLSFIVLKTSYFISVGKKTKKNNVTINEINNQFSKVKLGRWNAFLIFSRMLFFNLANDLFLVLFFWVFYFGIVSLIYALIGNIIFSNFGLLASIIGILGILSGFFQYFVNEYKSKVVDKTVKKMGSYLVMIFNELSFKEFLKYIQEENLSLYNEIKNTINLPGTRPLLEGLASQREGKSVFQFPVYSASLNDDIYPLFIENTQNKKIKENIVSAYEEFFKNKEKELNEKIAKLPFDELKRVFFEDYYFFQEMIPALEMVGLESDSKKTDKPKSFTEFKNNLTTKIMEDLVFTKILGVDENGK